MKRATACTTTALLVSWLSAAALADEPAAPRYPAGVTTFQANCAVCHGMDASGGKGPNLRRAHIARAPDEASLCDLIETGIPPEMPAGAFLLDGPVDREYMARIFPHAPGEPLERNLHNRYLQDRNEQRTKTFTGIGTVFNDHDRLATESMGPIFDRSQEHLGTSDVALIAWRRLMLRTAKALDETGEAPPGVHADIPFGEISSETLVLAADLSWRDLAPLTPALVK